MDKTIYFQPPGIRPQYCEAGMISETDPDYIWYYDEPCKILISEVKIMCYSQYLFINSLKIKTWNLKN